MINKQQWDLAYLQIANIRAKRRESERRDQTEVPSPRGRALHTERDCVGELLHTSLDVVA